MIDALCVWCHRPTSPYHGIIKSGGCEALCDACVLDAAGVYLRGRHEFDLARRVEAFIPADPGTSAN